MATEENTIGFEVEKKVIDDFVSGKRNTFSVDINEDTYRDLLENIDGNLLVNVEFMPETFHGCYFYNGGKFPYFKKKSLKNIILTDGQHSIAGRIAGCTFRSRVRFFFGDKPGEPSREDPNGDSCIWEVTFKLTPVK